MRRVLVVWHSRTGLARAMADALEEGASLAATGMESELTLVRRAAGEATVEDLLSSDGYLFCAPENLAMVSGEMAEFFQRVYYHVFDTHESSSGYGESSRLLGRPYGLAVAAGSDGTSAARQVARICQGWRLKPVSEPLIIRNGLSQTVANILRPKTCSPEAVAQCRELGGLVASRVLL
ncbi:flavodoxin nitric oxide synthase [Chrysochromulina tobinii]|uniref:Flavodoxin nitric oxide synthase n=1 Tax=Chrysochromulina tobinii TaxID=1460289 RepID=A0A0M0J3F0_9EUKA|nr:flavodoxin nitric oxide synthase [Chrysochromulina tobinii]|eukprot:KOO20857.1 flavodoxin nitric oxide synthase [Chrysochromulina sp. CCMP291]